MYCRRIWETIYHNDSRRTWYWRTRAHRICNVFSLWPSTMSLVVIFLSVTYSVIDRAPHRDEKRAVPSILLSTLQFFQNFFISSLSLNVTINTMDIMKVLICDRICIKYEIFNEISHANCVTWEQAGHVGLLRVPGYGSGWCSNRVTLTKTGKSLTTMDQMWLIV